MNITVEQIRELLSKGLPGEDAHVPMSPIGRGRSSEALKKAIDVRKSAVAIVLFDDQANLSSVLIQRSTYKGVHSGQVCLPGGKKEDFEDFLHETALRECVEETGLKSSELQLIGELTPVYIPVSNHHVHPFIFHYPSTPFYKPDPREVVEVIPFGVADLIDDTLIKKTDIKVKEDYILKDVPYFDIQGRIVWGATAIILNEFREVLQRF